MAWDGMAWLPLDLDCDSVKLRFSKYGDSRISVIVIFILKQKQKFSHKLLKTMNHISKDNVVQKMCNGVFGKMLHVAAPVPSRKTENK